jgi:hypothetical protein
VPCSAGEDHIVRPVQQVQVALSVEMPDVAGVQPAVADRRRAEITVHHGQSAHDDLAVGDLRLHPGDDPSDGAEPFGVPVEVRRRDAGDHRGFGQTVALPDLTAERDQGLLQPARGKWAGAQGKGSHTADVGAGQRGMVEYRGQARRREGERGDSPRLDGP